MSITLHIENGVLDLACQGQHTLQQETAAIETAVGADEFVDGTNLLLDLSGCEVARTQDDVISLAVFLGEMRGRLGPRCAVVVKSQVQYGLARMLAAHAEPLDLAVNVFHDPAQAKLWLHPPG